MEPLTQAQARQYSPMALAFLGDSVYEVMVREYLLRQGRTSRRQNSTTKRYSWCVLRFRRRRQSDCCPT